MEHTQNLSDRLQAMTAKTASAEVQETTAFTPEAKSTAPVEETPEKRAKREKREKQANVVTTIKNSRKLSAEEIELRKAISKHMRVAGYIVNNGEKIDFASKKITNADNTVAYDFALKQFAPSTIRQVVIMVPTLLVDLLKIADKQSDDFKEKFNKYSAMSPEQMNLKPVVVDWKEIGPYIRANTLGYITESDAIFAPVYKKGKENVKVINSPADVTGKNGLPDGAALYIIRPANSKSKLAVKNTLRTKIATPSNIIPMKRYKSVPLKKSYTEEEAKDMIAAYLGRFTTQTDGKSKMMQYRGGPDFTIDQETGDIKATSYFPTAGQAAWISSNEISHWSLKDPATGEPLAIKDPAIALRVPKKGVKNPDVIKYPYDTETLTRENATTSSYHFDAATFGNIFKATNGLFGFEELQAAVKTVSKKSGTAKPATRTSLVGQDLIGIDEDYIISQLKNAGC